MARYLTPEEIGSQLIIGRRLGCSKELGGEGRSEELMEYIVSNLPEGCAGNARN